MAWLADYARRWPITANTVGIGALTDQPLPFVGPDLTGKVQSLLLNDTRLTSPDGETLIDAWWWESKALTAPIGHGRFDLAGGDAAELVGYLYADKIGDADISNQIGTYPATWLAHWAMNEASGNIADSTANAKTFTAAGAPAYAQTGQVDGAILFNGTTDYFRDDNDDGAFDFVGDFSIGAWVKTTQASSGQIIQKGMYGGSWMGWALEIGGTNGKRFAFGTNSTWVSDTADMNDGAWHFVVGVRSGATGYIYRDGTSRGSATVGSAATTNAYYASIGTRYRDPAGPSLALYFGGTVDGAFVVNTALSDSQILALYRAGSGTLWTVGAEEAVSAGGGPHIIVPRLQRVGPSMAGMRH